MTQVNRSYDIIINTTWFPWKAILLTGMPKDGTMHEKVDEAVGLISSLLKVKYPEENRSALSGIPSVR